MSGIEPINTDDYVDPFRACGVSYMAVDFPMCESGVRAIAAWNNIPVEKMPYAWHFYPNAHQKKVWERVIAAIRADSPGGAA